MFDTVREDLQRELDDIREAGLYKSDGIIPSPQGTQITRNGKTVLNCCANNYLGLGGQPALVSAAKAGLDSHGYGMSSVRFICGTQDLHKQLEARMIEFLG